RAGAMLAAVAELVLAAPFALMGALLGWVPYRFSGVIARKATKDEDLLSTVKLLAGSLFLFLGWAAESALMGFWRGAAWVVPTFAAAMATGYLALRFDELLRDGRAAWRALDARLPLQHGPPPGRTPARAGRRRRAGPGRRVGALSVRLRPGGWRRRPLPGGAARRRCRRAARRSCPSRAPAAAAPPPRRRAPCDRWPRTGSPDRPAPRCTAARRCSPRRRWRCTAARASCRWRP